MSDIKYAYPLIQNKVQPPHYVTPLLRRERLLDWLHAGANGRAMVIAAGAGYGKTTLLWQWEREVDFPCYWYKLDRNDRDWTLHISYLIEAISRRHKGFGHRAHSMLQQLGGPGSSRPGVAAYLLSEMHETLREPCTFIIDDWQYVASVTEVRGLWNQILRDAPATCRFVFASRAKPQLQFARFKTHGGYAELRTDALRFTDVEIDELFRDVYHDPLDPTELAELERRTEGWAVSLQLVEVSLRERKTPESRREFIQSITATTDSDLFEFLAEEVLDQQPEQTRNFLLCTSILQRIQPDLAERLAGVHDGARQLAELEQRGMFTYRLAPDDGRYRYHGLFREFLERRLIAERPDNEVTGLHIHAASYYETHEEWPEAIHHYLRAGLQPQAARLIAKYGEEVTSEGRLGLVDEWLQQLPAKTIHDNARLSLLHGEALGMRGEYDDAVVALERARSFFTRKGDRRMEALACLKLSSVFHSRGEPATSADFARQGLALAPPDARAIRLRLDGNLAITSTWIEEGLDAVASACMRIAAEASLAGWEHFAAIALHNLGMAQRLAGNLDQSRKSLERAAKFWSALPSSPFADNSELVMTLLLLNEVKRAKDAAEAGLHNTLAWPRPNEEAGYARAAVAVNQGQLDDAIDRLERLVARPTLGGLREEIAALLLEALYLKGAPASRLRDVLTLLTMDGSDPRLAPSTAPAIAYGRHATPSCSGACLGPARKTLTEWDTKGAHLLTTVGLVKLGPLMFTHHGARSTSAVIVSLKKAASQGLFPHLKWWLRPYSPFASALLANADGPELLVQMLENDPEHWRMPVIALLESAVGEVRSSLLKASAKFANKETIAALRNIPGQDILDARRELVRKRAPRVYIRAFGPLTIHHGHRNAPAVAVEKRRLRALLGVLVAFHGQALSRDAALDLLWPDADPAAAVNNLNQAVFQLRRLLTPSPIRDDGPQYVTSTSDSLSLNPALVETDLDQFRRQVAKLRSTHDAQDKVVAATAMVDIVRGQFLADLRYEPWMPQIETATHAELRESLLPIALGELDAPDLAVRASCALVMLDEYDERATLALATQLANGGRRNAAREVVVRFAQKVRDELDEQPSGDLMDALGSLAGTRGQSTVT